MTAFTLKKNKPNSGSGTYRRPHHTQQHQAPPTCSLGKTQMRNLGSAQDLAGQYMSRLAKDGRIQPEMVLDVLTSIGDAADWPKQNRPNVTHDSNPVPGICLGLVYALGGAGAKASLISEQFPLLAKFIVRWCRETLPRVEDGDFPFSSVQINFNYAAKKHVDGNNIGPSYIQCIGDHSGGRLWTADQGVVDCKNQWKLFDGNREHATQSFKGTRISFIAFTHSLYNKLKPDVQKRLLALGFNAARTDGKDFQYFHRYRAERSGLSDEHNTLFRRLLRERMASHPPPSHPGAVAVECYGRQADRGGGWISFVADGGRVQLVELKPNTTGVWCTVLSLRYPTAALELVEHTQFNFYKDVDGESERFAKHVESLQVGAVVVLSIADTACAKSRPLGPRFYEALKQLGGCEDDEEVGYRQAWSMIGCKGARTAHSAHGKRATLLRLQATFAATAAPNGSSIITQMKDAKTERCSIGDAITSHKLSTT